MNLIILRRLSYTRLLDFSYHILLATIILEKERKKIRENKHLREIFHGPVVIGGVGGSGTRVVAEIMKELGYYIGPLNKANDNLEFAKLFGSPEWFKKNHRNNKQVIFKRLINFEESMLTSLETNHSNSIGWGWKNPVTHIYIEFLAKYFKKIKYVLVIRNGLEMAYSSNQNQFYKWGDLYNIKPGTKADPKSSLQYWFAANEKAIRLGQELFNHNFLVINFNDLCMNPEKEIRSLISFLELDQSKYNIDQLAKLIHPPHSLGRHKKRDLSSFTEGEFDLIRKLGFTI
ncbi:sulfotransferase family protein [Metabacillus sediminilitoris]|uniref:sulfotransferase family protein n=1 Tax=Metabacillus sediminilitoris TaxID=2567941 RepID=UPI001454D7ED|nr:sulfotransferase [Metabacillus sediminilitoris]